MQIKLEGITSPDNNRVPPHSKQKGRVRLRTYDFQPDLRISPQIGIYYAMVTSNYERLIKQVEGLTQEQIDDRGLTNDRNSIAQLLRHIAVVDLHWVFRLQKNGIPEKLSNEFGPMYDKDGKLPFIEKVPLQTLLNQYKHIHDLFRDVCMHLTDEQLEDIVPFENGRSATIRWGIWHVADHTRHHYANIVQAKRYLSTANNIHLLQNNPYPGRGIIIGMTPSRDHYVHIYWIMGRSDNSRNRQFEREGSFVRNKAFDEAAIIDPSLIIYYPLKSINQYHIITNGDQTDTIMNGLINHQTFEESLFSREYEPDAPHFTPRISGIIDTEQKNYKLSILKSSYNREEACIRNFFNYSAFIPGTGHCIHTYSKEENGVMRSFVGEPFELPLFDHIDEVKDYYWNLLQEDNKISLLVKFIDSSALTTEISIINKYQSEATR